jgi:hypothetical protein
MLTSLEKNNYTNNYTNFQKRWLSPDDFEIEYGISKSTQSKMRMISNSSRMPFSKIGTKYIRYDRVAIDKWLKEHEVKSV